MRELKKAFSLFIYLTQPSPLRPMGIEERKPSVGHYF